MAGKDVLAVSPTGTGKTTVFVLPIVSKLSVDPYGVFALVLAPTRELAKQISEQFRLYGKDMGITVSTIVGGMSDITQSTQLTKCPHIVVATTGRILDFLKRGITQPFQDLQYLVLDEVDRLFEQNFWDDILEINKFLPKEKQTLLFTATKPPIDVCSLLKKDYEEWTAKDVTAPTIEHLMCGVPQDVRELYLIIIIDKLMKENDFNQVLVFTNHCESAETIALILQHFKFKVAVLHSKMGQQDRFNELSEFRAERRRILVSTDLASRGLDIPFVDTVIHYNAPTKLRIYVHRSGRTGRAGRPGKSILFVDKSSENIVKEIEEKLGVTLGVYEVDTSETIEKMREILEAKKDARIKMFKEHYGEIEKRRKEARKAQESISPKK